MSQTTPESKIYFSVKLTPLNGQAPNSEVFIVEVPAIMKNLSNLETLVLQDIQEKVLSFGKSTISFDIKKCVAISRKARVAINTSAWFNTMQIPTHKNTSIERIVDISSHDSTADVITVEMGN